MRTKACSKFIILAGDAVSASSAALMFDTVHHLAIPLRVSAPRLRRDAMALIAKTASDWADTIPKGIMAAARTAIVDAGATAGKNTMMSLCIAA